MKHYIIAPNQKVAMSIATKYELKNWVYLAHPQQLRGLIHSSSLPVTFIIPKYKGEIAGRTRDRIDRILYQVNLFADVYDHVLLKKEEELDHAR